jgi:hypothetical protein
MLYNNRIRYLTRPYLSCVSTFQTQFGIGKTRATRINAFLLNHPLQVIFGKQLHYLLKGDILMGMSTAINIRDPLRLEVVRNLEAKIKIFTYPMFRMFQNLPMSSGASKSTGKRNQLNPYLCHNINKDFYADYANKYYRRQLVHNDKPDQLKVFDNALLENEKNKKKIRKELTKRTRQAYQKNARFHK